MLIIVMMKIIMIMMSTSGRWKLYRTAEQLVGPKPVLVWWTRSKHSAARNFSNFQICLWFRSRGESLKLYENSRFYLRLRLPPSAHKVVHTFNSAQDGVASWLSRKRLWFVNKEVQTLAELCWSYIGSHLRGFLSPKPEPKPTVYSLRSSG